MKTFEISKRKSKNGMRKFKAVLHEIYPDGSIDEINEVGTIYNANGITWIKQYCENALPSLKDRSIRVEFLDNERTEIFGHGDTGSSDDGMPIFENAEVIGHFTGGYIDEIEDVDGNMKTVCIGEGYLDEMCYANYISKLSEDIENNQPPHGSVEIYRTDNNDSIKYKYGFKEKGRIPTEFIYSGYALLNVRPADNTARILELNKEDTNKMTDLEIKALISQTVNELSGHVSEINKCKEECATKIEETNKALENAIAEKNEIEANSKKIQEALDALQKELEEMHKKFDALWEERKSLEKALGEAKARERISEMDSAISSFSDDEKAYAKDEIDAFNADPIASEINSVVSKIWEGIGKAAKANAQAIAEQKSVTTPNDNIEDIFRATPHIS